MSQRLSALTVIELREAFASGRLSPVEAASASLLQADRTRELNVFVCEAQPDSVLAQARASEARWRAGAPLGPLDGIPITVKDALVTKEWPTLMGSRAVDPDHSLREDAPAVARVKEQGGIVLGKTTTPELGWKALGDSPLTSVTRNPWNPALTPGGSSSGSAAALAAGIGHAAIGTDAGGSVRIPGSFCGLVALKATRGRIPAYPPSSLGMLGHNGPMCRDVCDTALMLAILSQTDARDWNGAPPDAALYDWKITESSLKGMSMAYSPTFGYGKVQPEIAASVETAVKVLADLGAEIELIEAPFANPTPVIRILFAAGLAYAVRNMRSGQREVIEPALQEMIVFGESLSRQAFQEASEAAMTLGRQMRLFHESYCILLSPTVAVAPFAVGLMSPEGYDPSDWFSWAPFTFPFNMTGQPALTVPCGLTSDRLPIGLQLVGAPYAEKLLLSVARAFECAAPSIGNVIR